MRATILRRSWSVFGGHRRSLTAIRWAARSPKVPRGWGRVLLAEIHLPGSGLVLGVPLAGGVDRLRGPALGAGQRVAACVDAELPPAGGELSDARHRYANLRRAIDGWHDGWHAGNLKKPWATAKGF